jgi:signal transduction histidine kinase
MNDIARDVIAEMVAVDPQRKIELHAVDNQCGNWDGARITQALTNLVGNAVEHGTRGSVVTVKTSGTASDATIEIHNFGTAIPHDLLNGIFNPMKVRENTQNMRAHGPAGNLGLGLYIAERIVNAHHGRINVTSSDADGTTFTVSLPKGEPRPAKGEA